ncbi:MAG: DNA mismatch repair protein MutS [Natronomonas sp.]
MADGIVGEYRSLQRETDADLLAMQVGDFYEFFAEDAETVGDELDLAVSQKASHGSSYPMAGVPVDDLTPYLKALVERGYRVAVADQGDEETTREIVRVATPGTLLETDDTDSQYLVAVTADDDAYGLAACDVTTGRFRTTTIDGRDPVRRLLSELRRHAPVEILPGPRLRNDETITAELQDTDARVTLHEPDAFAPGRAKHTLTEQFGTTSILPEAAAMRAAGAVVDYVAETGVGTLAAVTRLETYSPDDHVAVDETTRRNLELIEPMTDDGRSLLSVLDHTETSAGRRLLSEWLCRPSRDKTELRARQDAIAALAEQPLQRERLREHLDAAADLERAATRAVSGSADARTLLGVRETLSVLPAIRETIESMDGLGVDSIGGALTRQADSAGTLREQLDALGDDPPKTLRDGGLIRRGYDDQLDELIDRHETAVDFFEGLAEREKRRHDFSRVTVDRNKTDGYYVQIPKSETDAVPESYDGIKTLKNAQRYVSEELREHEREVLRSEEARNEREYEVFCALREAVGDAAETLRTLGQTLARLDVCCSLATHAAKNGWCRPAVTDEGVLSIEAGRHPVVEQSVEFVPNDLHLDRDRRLLLVTGPNMSGKSTYMRQAALVTLLAQIGSFVPAEAATVGLVDGIYTRVGALDDVAGGRSTFMVEMSELSHILHSAGEDSLVVLDEVGRGTATYDGISIAWAATEYLHNEVGAFTLFATHYHELTTLTADLPRADNVHVAVAGDGDDVTFLRTVEPGPADRSYGVHVADMAGVPQPVVDRSRSVLDALREDRAIETRGGSDETVQAVFDLGSGAFREHDDGQTDSEDDPIPPETAAVLDEIEEVDVNATSPLEILSLVEEWQRRLR